MKLKTLTIAFDPSASISKGIYKIDGADKRFWMVLPNEIIQIESQSNWLTSNLHKDTAVLEIGNQKYAVGSWAQNSEIGIERLKEAKYELSGKRIAAMIGLIAERHQLPNQFNVNLATFLPCGEMGDGKRLEQLIKTRLSHLVCNNKKYSIKLNNWMCLAEGSGLAYYGFHQSLKNTYQLVLMLGYRNASFILFQDNEAIKGQSTRLGFHEMLENICQTTSAQSPKEIASIIYQIGNQKTNESFKPLLKSQDAQLRQMELQEFKKAIRQNRKSYLNNLKTWLKSQQFPDLSEVILGGGTANYFKKELEQYWPNKTNWVEHLEKDVQKLIDEPNYTYRFTDLNGLWHYFNSPFNPLKVAKNEQ